MDFNLQINKHFLPGDGFGVPPSGSGFGYPQPQSQTYGGGGSVHISGIIQIRSHNHIFASLEVKWITA